jgi:hypothetical protein
MFSKSAITGALITAVIISFWLIGGFSFLSVFFSQTPKVKLRTLTGGIGLILLFIGVLIAIRSAKQHFHGRKFSYLMALQSGLTVSVIVAIVVSFFSFIYLYFFNPAFTADMVNEAKNSLQASGASSEEIASKLAHVKREYSLPALIIAPLIVQTAAGSVFSLLISLFYFDKKQK